MLQFYKYIIFTTLVISGCSLSGPVLIEQTDSLQTIVPEPNEFSSPTTRMDDLFQVAKELESKLPAKNLMKSKEWNKYLFYREAFETESLLQSDLETQLYDSGEIILKHGNSYEFDLQTYCVNAGIARPLVGDGFRIGKLKGPAEKWLPAILKSSAQDYANHDQIQSLIWALLMDVRFDELSEEQQQLLGKIFPDAACMFGNRRLENLGQEFLRENFPEISEGIDQIRSWRHEYLSLKENFEDLKNKFAPSSGRTAPIPVGWMQMDEGYFLKVTSSDEFRAVRISIYVPEIKRKPNVNVVDGPIRFRPWEWIVLPSEGQRLGLSVKSIRTKKALKKDICSEFKKWRPTNCRPLSDGDREKILAIADPSNFPKTRYQSPPRFGAAIEEETDCSNFVQAIYSRAGFRFPYSPTSSFACLRVFKQAEFESVKNGDVVLYDGHVAIYAGNGRVISPTCGGEQRLSTLEITDQKFKPAITLDKLTTFKNGRVLKWSCPQ